VDSDLMEGLLGCNGSRRMNDIFVDHLVRDELMNGIRCRADCC